jgi:hypothetical protein
VFGAVSLKSESIELGQFSVLSYGRVEGSHTVLSDFAETGGDMALAFDRQYLNMASAFIGVDVGHAAIRLGKGELRPYAKMEYGFRSNYRSDVNMRYVLDTTDYKYVLDEHTTSRWKALAGIDYQISTHVFISFMYSREQGTNSDYLNDFGAQASVNF